MSGPNIRLTRDFVQAYPWMLPGIVACLIAGGMVNGGWGLLTPLVFAGAAKAEGLHDQMSLVRLALHRFFSFFGIAVGTALIFILAAAIAWQLLTWLAPDIAYFGWFWLGLFVALAWWPLVRLWMAPALPFIVDEDLGGQASFSYFLWVGPGMFSAFAWSAVPGQLRRGMPVFVLLALVAAIFLLAGAGAPDSDGRLPTAVALVMTFGIMPATVYVWLRCAQRAYHAAIGYQQQLDRQGCGHAGRLSPQQLLVAGVEGDDRLWINMAVTQGADIGQRDSRGDQLLHRAAGIGSVEAITALVEAGADINALNVDGYSPLAIAAEQNRPESVAVLAHSGSDLDSAGGGRPPLCLAAGRGHHGVIEQLLALGAAVEPHSAAMSDARNWPLLCAVRGGDERIVGRIIQAGARPPDATDLQRRLLDSAAESRNEAILRQILTLFDDEALARELPSLHRTYAMLQVDRPAGYGPVIAILEQTLDRLGLTVPSTGEKNEK